MLVPMSIEATLLIEVGLDFTTEFLWKGVGCQFGVKDLEEYHSNLISIVSGILSDKSGESIDWSIVHPQARKSSLEPASFSSHR